MRIEASPPFILSKLLLLETEAAKLGEQVLRSNAAIESGQRRLRGGAHGLQQREHDDLIASIKEAVAQLPKLQAKASTAQIALQSCKAWLAGLPEHTQLKQKMVDVDGHDLSGVRNRMASIKSELAALRAVPTPSPDLEQRIRDYVAALAKPRIEGFGAHEHLKITWRPNEPALLAAILAPDVVVAALLKEVERASNIPMPLPERQQKISALEHEYRELLYLEEALLAGGDERSASALPFAILSAAIVVAGKNGNGKGDSKTETKPVRRSVRRHHVTAAERAQLFKERNPDAALRTRRSSPRGHSDEKLEAEHHHEL